MRAVDFSAYQFPILACVFSFRHTGGAQELQPKTLHLQEKDVGACQSRKSVTTVVDEGNGRGLYDLVLYSVLQAKVKITVIECGCIPKPGIADNDRVTGKARGLSHL